VRHRWTDLPLPQDAIDHVNHLGHAQHMPRHLTFGDRYGVLPNEPAPDTDDDDSSDSTYLPPDLTSTSHDSDSDGDDLSDDNGADDDDFDDSDSDNNDSDDDNPGQDNDSPGNTSDSVVSSDSFDSGTPLSVHSSPPIPPTGVSPASASLPDAELGVPSSSTGVADPPHVSEVELGVPSSSTGVPAPPHVSEGLPILADALSASSTNSTPSALADDLTSEEDDSPPSPQLHPTHSMQLRPHRARSYRHRYQDDYHYLTYSQYLHHEPMLGAAFLTEQVSLKRGLQLFGSLGADAVVAELQQLDYRSVIQPEHASSLSPSEKRAALRYLMYLKQKRSGRIKACGCADGRKQRAYKSKDETSSPTVSTEAVFLTSLIDAQEGRYIVTVDIPGAFMHATIDELIHVRLEGVMAQLLVRVNPSKYAPYLTTEGGKPVIYVRLLKALYGTLQAALLFWENLSSFLVSELGFEPNRYDSCVVNKSIDGQQCTIAWHVDDLKISHLDPIVVEHIVDQLNERYGKEEPISVHHGPTHDYLGMQLDFSKPKQLVVTMTQYIQNVLADAPPDMEGTASTPAANHLFDINPNCDKLDPERSELFHHITAQLLYLCKRARPDIQTAVAFLCTRVTSPDLDDWKKLARCIRYLRGTVELPLTLEADPNLSLRWWVDASFAVHHDMRSHTGSTMTLGKGSIYSASIRQKINTKSSTEAELVAVSDAMNMVAWVRNFLLDQGFDVSDNVIYQDNQSAILLARNGRSSSGKRTRHIDIRYFFVSDRIKQGEVRVEYCPTEDMLGDFFTKPLQGATFQKMRRMVLNLSEDVPLPLTTTRPQECVETATLAMPSVARRKASTTQDQEWSGSPSERLHPMRSSSSCVSRTSSRASHNNARRNNKVRG